LIINMTQTSHFVRGMYVMLTDGIYSVEDRSLKTQGRQGGLIILKLRNIKTGNILTETLKAGAKLEEVLLETKKMQYLYADDKSAYFMDSESFETVPVKKEVLGDYLSYLKEGEELLMLVYEDEIVDVKRNPSVVLEVTEAEDAIKGNTANNAMKDVILETGLKIKVPMFIKKGDKVVVNTESGVYSKKF
jgi:elongation factor P